MRLSVSVSIRHVQIAEKISEGRSVWFSRSNCNWVNGLKAATYMSDPNSRDVDVGKGLRRLINTSVLTSPTFVR